MNSASELTQAVDSHYLQSVNRAMTAREKEESASYAVRISPSWPELAHTRKALKSSLPSNKEEVGIRTKALDYYRAEIHKSFLAHPEVYPPMTAKRVRALGEWIDP